MWEIPNNRLASEPGDYEQKYVGISVLRELDNPAIALNWMPGFGL